MEVAQVRDAVAVIRRRQMVEIKVNVLYFKSFPSEREPIERHKEDGGHGDYPDNAGNRRCGWTPMTKQSGQQRENHENQLRHGNAKQDKEKNEGIDARGSPIVHSHDGKKADDGRQKKQNPPDHRGLPKIDRRDVDVRGDEKEEEQDEENDDEHFCNGYWLLVIGY